MQIVIASSARKHGIGRERIFGLLVHHDDVVKITRPGDRDPKLCILSRDENDIEWEVIAVVLPDTLLVIHAMPTHYRPPHFSWRPR